MNNNLDDLWKSFEYLANRLSSIEKRLDSLEPKLPPRDPNFAQIVADIATNILPPIDPDIDAEVSALLKKLREKYSGTRKPITRERTILPKKEVEGARCACSPYGEPHSPDCKGWDMKSPCYDPIKE